MRNALRIVLALSLLYALAGSHSAAQRGPSTPAERAKAVELARKLEKEPLAKDAKNAREWLLRWLVEIPDISVSLCNSYLQPLLEKKKDYSSEIFAQSMYSMAAFIIENPGKAKDNIAVQTAGVEGSLRAYEAIRREKPKVKWEFLDDLIAKRDAGQLADYVTEKSSGCK